MTGDRWDSWPTHRSQQFFVQMMERHDHVRKVEKLSASRYDVTRHDRTKIRVFMTDVYEFTVSDYAELCNEYPDVNCIVQASTWNHFTSGVREEARSDDVATFHFKGLMGALNYKGDAFLDYPDVQY